MTECWKEKRRSPGYGLRPIWGLRPQPPTKKPGDRVVYFDGSDAGFSPFLPAISGPSTASDPGDGVVYFAYRRTVFRLSFNSRAMRRSDQPRAASVWIVLIIGALRRFIAPFSADSPAVAQWLLKVAYFDPVPNWYPLAVPRHWRV